VSEHALEFTLFGGEGLDAPARLHSDAPGAVGVSLAQALGNSGSTIEGHVAAASTAPMRRRSVTTRPRIRRLSQTTHVSIYP
jgi:hypothetical protein